MSFSQPVILLTGRPGSGKTTIIRKVGSRLGPGKAGGFYTREIRQAGQRTGFEIVTLAGQTDLLATKLPDISLARAALFGPYRVNLEAIDRLVVPALLEAVEQDQIVLIDEIGPMEILSEAFCQMVLDILDSPNPVIGTIVQRPNPFADRVKEHRRVTIRQVTPGNRSRLPELVYAELAAHLDS